MRIVLKSKRGPNIRLPIPSELVLNRVTAGLVRKHLKECGLTVSKKQTVAFLKTLNRYRRKHPEWVLVEAQSSDGTYVQIKL